MIRRYHLWKHAKTPKYPTIGEVTHGVIFNFLKYHIQALFHNSLPNTKRKKESNGLSLRLVGKRLREPAHVVIELTFGPQKLDVGPIDLDFTGLTLLEVLVAAERSEPPVLRDDDLLATREPVFMALASHEIGGE